MRIVSNSVVAAGDELVRVDLVAGVPDEPVLAEVEGQVQGQAQLDDAEVAGEVGRADAAGRATSSSRISWASCASWSSVSACRSAGDAIRGSNAVMASSSRVLGPRPSARRLSGPGPPRYRASSASGSRRRAERRRGARAPRRPSSLGPPAALLDAEQARVGQLAAGRVLAHPLAGLVGRALDVEQVVGDLERQPERRGRSRPAASSDRRVRPAGRSPWAAHTPSRRRARNSAPVLRRWIALQLVDRPRRPSRRRSSPPPPGRAPARRPSRPPRPRAASSAQLTAAVRGG